LWVYLFLRGDILSQVVKVIVEDTGHPEKDLERALRKFRKEEEAEDILNEIKKRQYFTKPSAIKHEQKKHSAHKAELEKKEKGR